MEVDLRIWDLFLRDGEAALILAALGILKMYEDQLLLYDFDHLASFLTGPMPESMSPDILVSYTTLNVYYWIIILLFIIIK